MIITLTGFMGCGKSSVGRRLSELLCCPFMDLDTLIEEDSGKKIPEIFSTQGEKAFRQMEKEALERIIRKDERCGTIVLALGGGAVMNPDCERMIHENTRCVYLRTGIDTLVQRLTGETSARPLLSATGTELRTRIEEMTSLRSATYERTSHIVIGTDNLPVDTIAKEIIRNL